MLTYLLSRLFPHLERHRTFRAVVLVTAISVVVYVAGNTISFIVQVWSCEEVNQGAH